MHIHPTITSNLSISSSEVDSDAGKSPSTSTTAEISSPLVVEDPSIPLGESLSEERYNGSISSVEDRSDMSVEETLPPTIEETPPSPPAIDEPVSSPPTLKDTPSLMVEENNSSQPVIVSDLPSYGNDESSDVDDDDFILPEHNAELEEDNNNKFFIDDEDDDDLTQNNEIVDSNILISSYTRDEVVINEPTPQEQLLTLTQKDSELIHHACKMFAPVFKIHVGLIEPGSDTMLRFFNILLKFVNARYPSRSRHPWLHFRKIII
ncbi:unnamed protein product [Mucor hiemalis]